MRRAMLTMIMLAAAAAVLATASTPAANAVAERRCGDMGAKAPDYYDVRARNVACRRARRVVLDWAEQLTNVFDRVRVDEFTCKGRRSSRRIGGITTFHIRCADARRVVRWWIRPFH